MTFVAVMDWDENGRVAKFLDFDTLADAAVHAAAFVEMHPFAFATGAPSPYFQDWRVVDGVLVLDPYVKPKPTVIAYNDFVARLTEAELAALHSAMVASPATMKLVLQAAADNSVNLESLETIAFVQGLVAGGAITEARAAEILAP